MQCFKDDLESEENVQDVIAKIMLLQFEATAEGQLEVVALTETKN